MKNTATLGKAVFLATTILHLFGQTATGQCDAVYTTANNFCDLSELFLTAVPVEGQEPFTYEWETGETTQTITIPLAASNYWVTITDAVGCTLVLYCHIKPSPLVLYYPFNQNACEGDTVTLFLQWFRDSIPGATYLWSTGATTPTIELTDDLIWSVTVTDPATGCEFIIPPGLFDFHPTPYPEIVGPQMICGGQTITLSVTGGPFGTVIWYTEDFLEEFVGETYVVDEPGIYYVWGSSPEVNYCWHQDTIEILTGSIDPPILEGPPALCNGQSGSLNITNSSLYSEFVWSTGQTTASIIATQPGTYSVTVTNPAGCTASGAITIGNGSGYDIMASVTGTTCGQNNGTVLLDVTPPDSYTYNWSNGSTSENLSGISAGSYTVTVTSSGGCTVAETILIPDNPIPVVITEVITPNTLCNGVNAAIDISLQPSGSYTYLWSNGSTAEDLQNVGPGIYSITATLGMNCSATETYTIENNTNAPDAIAIDIPETCGQSNGSIDLNVSGGNVPYTFIWSNGATTEDLVDLSAATYSVTVTGADGCSTTEIVVLENTGVPIAISADVISVTSCIESNGSIDISVSPSGQYTFLWSNGSTTEDLNNLSEGIYSVEVSLGEDCTETASFTISHTGSPVTLTALTSSNNACATPNGAIDLTLAPEDNYTFSWSNGSTTEDLNGLPAGTYAVTITNSENCLNFGTFTIENTTEIPVFTPALAHPVCGQQNGSIDITVSTAGTHTFLWSNGETTEDLANLSPGVYQVTITADNGCTVSDTFDLQNVNSTFTLSGTTAPNQSCVNPDGWIDLSVSPSGSYSFLWSNGSLGEDLSNVPGGDYTVTVTDSQNCSASSSFAVISNTVNPTTSYNVTPATCGQANGQIDLSVTPAEDNAFLWSTGVTTEDLDAVSPGLYTVTITGSNGCSAIDTLEVPNTNSGFTLGVAISANTSCAGPNGFADITMTPTGSYTFLWSNGVTTEDVHDLAPGIYTVTVTDSLNCAAFGSIVIEDNAFEPLITAEILPASCDGQNGSIMLEVISAGGNQFLWSHGATAEDIVNLAAGNYTVTVTDLLGCTASVLLEVPEISSEISLSANILANTSCTNANGAIDLHIVSSGTYIVLWSNGASAEDLTNLAAGNYRVTITDHLGCTTTESFEIPDQTMVPVIEAMITHASCGQLNGSIDLRVTPGNGNVFLWSNGATSEDLSQIAPGIYSVTVTGANGCTSAVSVEIQNTGIAFSLSAVTEANTSCLSTNGLIDLTMTPSGAYIFNWSNGMTTEDLLNVSAGIYDVTITDNENCSITESFLIEDLTAAPIVEYITTPAICGEDNGGIDLTVITGGSNTFLWSTGETTEDLYAMTPGVYSVTVSDSLGCTWSDGIPLLGSVMPTIDLIADLTVEYGKEVILRAEINVPPDALDTVIWLPGNLFSCTQAVCLEQSIMLTEQTEVTVMVFDTNGCMAEESVMLFVHNQIAPGVFIPNVFSPNADGSNDVFTVFANPDVEEIVDLRIFDRWGEFVFQNTHFPPNTFEYGWDGNYRSKLMQPGVFVYWTLVKFKDGREQLYKGDVTLIR